MTAHTPGPWRMDNLSGYGDHEVWFNIEADAGSGCVAEAICVEANARLISAAPDLLEALIECQQGEHEGSACWCAIPSMIPYRGHDAGCSAARAAIAKATGGAK